MSILTSFIPQNRRKKVFRAVRIVSAVSLLGCALLVGCASPYNQQNEMPPRLSQGDAQQDAVPKAEARSRYGNPSSYVVAGNRYHVLKTSKSYEKTGMASWYGTKFHGRLTSSREPYDMHAMTAASPHLPIPSYAHVTNLSNGHTVIVKVNDRGPFKSDRIMDLSYAAAKKLGYLNHGTAKIRVTAIDTTDKKTMLVSLQRHEDGVKLHMNGKTPKDTQMMLAENKVDLPAVAKQPKLPLPNKTIQLAQLSQQGVKGDGARSLPHPVQLAQASDADDVRALVTQSQSKDSVQLADRKPNTQPEEITKNASRSSTYLQLGAFKAHDKALSLSKEVSTLTNVNVSVKTAKPADSKEPIYLVNLGPISDRKMSTELQAVLAKNGFERPLIINN
jgi:rare lipoprotein A (peptidoglycan hydrolase)